MGAVLGAALAVCLPELLRDLQGAWLLAYAVATLVVVLWAPEGLAGLIDRLRGAPLADPPTWTLPERLPAVAGPRRLVLDKVVKRFGGVEALAGVSFTVGRGEIVGLIGPNGSGKTTLLNVIGGLERADSGTIVLDDRRLERLPPHAIARAGVGRTFQTLALAGDTPVHRPGTRRRHGRGVPAARRAGGRRHRPRTRSSSPLSCAGCAMPDAAC